MRSLLYWIPVVLFAVIGCTSSEENHSVPFELMPNGLKKKIEQEVIAEMEREAIANMERLHAFYSNMHFIPSTCYGIYKLFHADRKLNGSISIRHEIDSLSNIPQAVFLYYTANERLTPKEVNQKISDSDYAYYNYPFYSHVTLPMIENEIEKNGELLSEAHEGGDENLIEFYEKALQEWESKRESILVLETDELREIQVQTGITIEDDLNKKGLSPLTQQAIKGFIGVREFAAQKYFETSYFDLYFQATRTNDELATKRLNTINRLYKVNLIDESYAELNNLRTGWDLEPQFEEIAPLITQ